MPDSLGRLAPDKPIGTEQIAGALVRDDQVVTDGIERVHVAATDSRVVAGSSPHLFIEHAITQLEGASDLVFGFGQADIQNV